MVSFVRGLLQTMQLSSLTQRIVRDRYKQQCKKDQPLTPKQSDLLRAVVVDVAKAEMSREPVKAPVAKAVQDPIVNASDHVAQKRPAELKTEENPKKVKVAESSDDELEILGVTRAEVLPHCRADCPVDVYKPTDNVKIGPYMSNAKFCDKCFCYICDKAAKDCASWAKEREPHCNANSKEACWKARRMVVVQVKFTFLNRYLQKHITPQRQPAVRAEAQIICVDMRETYQIYRMGEKCDAKLVPCNCSCHRGERPSNWCGKCRSVHDLKKQFDYRIVRAKVKDLIKMIQQWSTSLTEQLFLFEIILNELSLHKGADINQMTQQSGNPDKDAQCNNQEVLKAEYMLGPIATCIANNSGLWKDLNESLRLAFRSQAISDNFIKSFFEALQSHNVRARGQNRMQPQQHVQVRHIQPNQGIAPFNQQRVNYLGQQGMMIQNQARPPGQGTMPFQRGASKGSGIREVRANAPANCTPTIPRGTTLAVATVATTNAGAASEPRPPAGLFSMAGATLQAVTVQTNSFQSMQNIIMSEQQERDLEEKCEANIKKGQFNSTMSDIRPIVMGYRSRKLWFIGKGVYRIYLVCLAHTDPIETLKELWNMEKHIRQQFGTRQPPWRLDASDMARILCIAIQDVPSIKKVVITRRFSTPPEWPFMGPIQHRPFKKLGELMRGVFLVVIALVKTTANESVHGNADLLVFALRIFCPMWSHTDGNNLSDMLRYYNQTREINKELEPEKVCGVSFEAMMRNVRMREKADSCTTRVFCIAFLLAKHVLKWEGRHPEDIINLLAHPRTKYTEVSQAVPLSIWNFALFALCNQNEVAGKMIQLGKYQLLEWYQNFLSSPESGQRYNIISNYLNIQVVKTLVGRGKLEFSVKLFDCLFNTISDFFLNGKLNMEAKRKYYDKYIDIGSKFLDRIRNELTSSMETVDGMQVIKTTPEWFDKVDYLEALSYGIIDLMAEKRAQLLLVCLYKKTSIVRSYPTNAPVHVSLQLFGDRKHTNDFPARYKFQSRLLGAFVSSSVQSLQALVEPYHQHIINNTKREDSAFLNGLRLLQSCTRSRFTVKTPWSIDHKLFTETHFKHHCNTTNDGPFNLALTIQTILFAEDDCMEHLHLTGLEILAKTMGDCCFDWLTCRECLINSTKMVDERIRVGVSAFSKFLNRLMKIRYNKGPGPHFSPNGTTPILVKMFLAKFWDYIDAYSKLNYNQLAENFEKKVYFHEVCNSYDIIGKVIQVLCGPFQLHLSQSVGNHISKMECDLLFKNTVIQFITQLSKHHVKEPHIRFKSLSEVFKMQPMIKNGQTLSPVTKEVASFPSMPKLKRKPRTPSPSGGSQGVASPASNQAIVSDDDYSPDMEPVNGIHIDGSTSPTRKKTRYESDRQRHEAHQKKKDDDVAHQKEWTVERSILSVARITDLKKKGFHLPVAFQTKHMLTFSLDPITNRASRQKKPIKLKLGSMDVKDSNSPSVQPL